jgi:dTDP-4-dehydrorhamnose 3,5-epimerase
MKIQFEKTPFAGLLILTPESFADSRGRFSETYREDALAAALGRSPGFVQDNESVSKAGVFRGLHFQVPPHAQAKLVRVSRGRVIDYCVDLREKEPTFGQVFSAELSAENRCQLYIPGGFAHGFLVLEDDTIFSYKCTEYYRPESDRCLSVFDAGPGIALPHPSPSLSDKDRNGGSLADFRGVF